MKRAGLLLTAIVYLLLYHNLLYAWEWKRLHEEADKTSLSEALMAVGQKPDSIDNLYIAGLVYLNLHKDQEANAVFKKIQGLDPNSLGAQWGIAEVMRRQHRLRESEERLERIAKADPNFSPVYISLAYIKYIQMQFNKSVELADRVIRQGSNSVDLSNYTRAYLIKGGAKGMIAHYGGPVSKAINGMAIYPNLKKAESLQPDAPEVFFGLGTFYFLAPGLVGGNKDKAKIYLHKAIKADPLFSDAYVRLAQLYKNSGDHRKYEFYLNQALKIDPQNELAVDVKNGKCHFICAGGEE